jgi:putative hydrolase of the HAD superfamily
MPTGELPSRPRFRAVLFDVGGTLVEDRDFSEYAEIAEHLQIPAHPEAIGEAVRWADQTLDRSDPRPTTDEYWRQVLERASGRELPTTVAQRFVERLERLPRVAHLFSDVRRTLERLRSEGRRLGIISNSRSEWALREMLESVGILGYFQAVVSSGSEGVEKPDPEIFRRAVLRLGVGVDEAFYVGDLAYTDARAAERAGLAAVWLNRDGTGFGTDPPEITSLSELPRWVARLEGALVK